MAIAAFSVMKCTGTNASTETDTSKTPTFLSSDLHSTNTTAYPVAVPISMLNYSYECWLRLKCTAAPNTSVSNFKIFGPSTTPDYNQSPPNRLRIYMGTTATGATPIGNNASSIAVSGSGARQDTTYYSVGTALTFHAGSITAINQETNYVVLQLQVWPNAVKGAMGVQSFYIQYDEV